MMNKQLQVRIPAELHEQFRAIAAQNAQNPSALVRKWIEEYVRDAKK